MIISKRFEIMIYKFYKILIFISISLIFSTHASSETKLLGTERDWNAWSTINKKEKTCYISSTPTKTTGKFNRDNRGQPYVFVTNIKAGTNYEVSVVAGFNFKKNKDVIFNVDGKKTKLFPVDDRAWSESTKMDRVLVQSMRKGQKLTITGISSPGNKIIDTYSLLGFTKALRLIEKSCS